LAGIENSIKVLSKAWMQTKKEVWDMVYIKFPETKKGIYTYIFHEMKIKESE